MKNSKIKLFALAGVASLALMSCKGNVEEKQENLDEAKEDVMEAKQELSAARMDSINEYAKYRKEVEMQLQENDKKIAEIGANIKMKSASVQTQMKQDLEVLKQKNEAFKLEMREKKEGMYSDWETFKSDLNTNLDEFGKSISKLADENKKK